MTKNEYNSKRALALRILGIFMLVNSVLFLIIGPSSDIHERKHCTEYVVGRVVSVEGEAVQISYSLPGEGEDWLVTKHGSGWEKGDQVRVFYNPADLSEKYIEGWEDSPLVSVILGLVGTAVSIGVLFLSRAAKKDAGVNKVFDLFDRQR